MKLKTHITSNHDGEYSFKATNFKNQAFTTKFITSGKVVRSQASDIVEKEIAVIDIPNPTNWTKIKIYKKQKEIFCTTFRKFSKPDLERYSITIMQCDSVYKIQDWGPYGMADEAVVLFKHNSDKHWRTQSIFRKELNQWANQGEWGDFLVNKDQHEDNHLNCEVQFKFRYGLQWIIYDFPPKPETP